MPSPLLSLFTRRGRKAVETIVPERTFDDVVLPPATRRTLDAALAQVRNQALIFDRWGLGERHATGLGLAFNFAGPPGTGKTICAEAIAHALGRPLLVVNYAQVESMWMGETAKNVAAVFREAGEQGAVLFFDEADAIAARRSVGASRGFERESNAVVSTMLRELEGFNGVVVFATNLAANFDPAFERRIRTHVLFEMPGVEERERIWMVQLHPTRTPLGHDVDFRALAERWAVSGGDIKNAVLKAAALAAAEPGPEIGKGIDQRHFVAAMEEVVAARSVMRQSIFDADGAPVAIGAEGAPAGAAPGTPLGAPGDGAAAVPATAAEAQLQLALQALEARWRATTVGALALGGAALVAGVAALVVAAVR